MLKTVNSLLSFTLYLNAAYPEVLVKQKTLGKAQTFVFVRCVLFYPVKRGVV